MPLDPSALPLLLAGPILRRVESDLVSVWIATSRSCDVSLWLYVGGDVVASENPFHDPRAAWVSRPQRTLQVGANLHVLTVVLDLRIPDGNAERSSSATLDANHPYSYDLQLLDRTLTGQPHNLRSLGLLEGSFPLGYDPEDLPAFRTCPQELDRLVILHGSCRQLFEVPPVEDDPALDDDPFVPPGGWPRERPTPESPRHAGPPDPFPSKEYPLLPKRDGMLWVDALIDARGPTPMVDRPHQLFLTGDQIYADQPPASLTPVLNTLARLLVGEEELGADPTGTVFKLATLENFPPAFRGDTVRRSGGFTMGGRDHLLSFGEFAAYYLLTWSPALWELDLWPADFDAAAIAAIEPPTDWVIRFIYKREPVDAESRSEDNFTDDYQAVRETFPETLEDVDPDDPLPLRGEPPEVHAAWYFLQVRDWIASKYWSPALFEWWTRRFRRGLPRVRRALANVATYMVADDHDITDDWNLSRQWREQVYTRPLGVDIVRNGLMALTLMQSWGNDPRRWATGRERELLDRIAGYAPGMAAGLPRETLNRLHELLGLPQTVAPPTAPTFRPLVEYSFQVEGPRHRVLAVDGRAKRRFLTRTSKAGGIDFEGATGLINDDLPTGLPGEEATGLFGDSPMAAALPPRPAGDTKLTIVVTGVPVIGPEGMELTLSPLQRFARLLPDVDAESWAYEATTYEALLAAMARYESVVILSGDVHIGWSAALDYWSAPDGEPVRTARMVQLVSSGLTKDWGDFAPALRGHALTLDIFESATTAALLHAERIGWGAPLRTELTPPPLLGPLVTQAERAHPFYQERLKKKAPVVPTHGWPQGATEVRDPNWAWRAVMARDDRVETMQPPNFERRWTPVELPANPIDPSRIGWHAHAARRMAFGRVFAAAPNVGIVTFELGADNIWSVRHVIAGELAPLADTGNVPLGLQPYIVHRFTLAPFEPASWNDRRPRIVDDGGWGVDTTDPVIRLLLESLPRIWQGAADFGGAVFDDLPPVIDDVTREALLTDAASRLSRPIRRRVLRELGPFALLSDSEIDALPDTIDERFAQLGRWNAGKEARALLRPDLVRLMAMKSAADPATVLDDVLLLACSEWVNDRVRWLSVTAGILATFRSPVTKHVPAVAGLLSGLWDLWRNRTLAEGTENDPLVVAPLTAMGRALIFGFRLLLELVNHVIQDHEPRPHGGPPIVTPELMAAALGIALGAFLPRRFTFASGWEPRGTPVAPGTRAHTRAPDSLARQTVTMLVHPGDRQRFTAPARNVSLTMIPPPPPEEDAPPHGSLLVGWDGGLEAEEPVGPVRVRVELDGRGFHRFLWGGSRNIEGRAGGTFRITFLRPMVVGVLPGADIRLTPALSVAVGVRSGVEEDSYRPAFTFRVALNDREDRVTFLPDDELLSQLLPADGLAIPVDAAFEWTLEHGFRFAGFGEATSAVLVDSEAPQREPPRTTADDFDEPPNVAPHEVVTPLNFRVGPLTFHERRLEVTTAADADAASLHVSVTATVSLNVGPVRIAVSGLGVRWTLRLSTEFESVDDLIDWSVGLPTPTGLAVSVDTDAVSGGGFIQRIESSTGVVTWRGGLALRIGRRYDVTAWGVVQTGGGRPYTLLVFLAIRFSPPIQLPFNFKVLAFGGLLALNRTMDVDALRDAAMAAEGMQLDPLLFPDRPEQRFLELLPAVERFFPPEPGHQVIGLMAEIEWQAETGTTFGRFRLALLGQLEDFTFALYGSAKLGLPSVDDPHILRVRATLEVLYDRRRQFLRASVTLTEAVFCDLVHLTGGAAALIRWGDPPDWAITLGGFHPFFRPFIPEGLREPPRLGAFWKPHDLIELSIRVYIARTPASLQFGFAGHLEAGASWGGLRADAEFNFLVMVAPVPRFEIDLSIRVTVFLFGCDLISASFRGAITGPNPWRIGGSVYWEVCGVDISKDLGPYEWGDPDVSVVTQSQEARQVLAEGLGDIANWTVHRNPRLPVRVRSGAEEVLDPRDQIDIRQTRLPLGVGLEVYDAHRLSDPGVWTLQPDTGGLAKVSDLTDVFPTRRYLARPPKETPFRGGLPSGVRVGGQGWSARTDLAIESDESITEDLVLDSIPARPPRRVASHVRVALADGVRVAAPTSAPERKWTRHALRLEPVA